MSGFLMLGVPEIVTRSSLNPQATACVFVAPLSRLPHHFAQTAVVFALRGNVPTARAMLQARQNLGRSLGVAGGRRHDFWHSMKQRRPPAAPSELSKKVPQAHGTINHYE